MRGSGRRLGIVGAALGCAILLGIVIVSVASTTPTDGLLQAEGPASDARGASSGVSFVPVELWPELPRPGGAYEQVAHLMTHEAFDALEPIQQQLLARLAVQTWERHAAQPAPAAVDDLYPGRPAICWAPGSTPAGPMGWLAGAGVPAPILAGAPARWTGTVTDGGGLTQGRPTTLTWAIVPDGTTINAEPSVPTPAGPSILIASLDNEYGDAPGAYPPTGQSWFPLIQGVFDVWQTFTGVTYVFEPNDDGAAMGQGGAAGVIGTRAEIRLGSYPIDGNSGILAFNYYPNNGDMVYDALDFSLVGGPGAFFADTSSSSIRLRNVTSHEHGHGLGMPHVCPIQSLWLMEPFYTAAFDGPQLDDLLTGSRGYGDHREDDDASAQAGPLGSYAPGSSVLVASLTGSYVLTVDGLNDNDWFSFTTTAPAAVELIVTPESTAPYLQDPQTVSPCPPTSGNTYDPSSQCDLDLELLDAGLTQIGYADSWFPGTAETIAPVVIPPGTYYVRVGQAAFFALDAVQRYQLALDFTETVSIACPATPPSLDCNVAGGFQGVVPGFSGDGPAAEFPVAVRYSMNGGPLTFVGNLLAPGPFGISIQAPNLMPCGSNTLLVELTGQSGSTADCSTTVEITDTTPPNVTCSATRTLLYPARGALINIGLSVGATDLCDPSPLVYAGVWSNEGNGAAPFTPDASFYGNVLLLRSDRAITGTGRVYLIRGRVDDQCSTAVNDDGFGCCTVIVPKIPTAASIMSLMADATAAEDVCNGVAAGSTPGDIPTGYVALAPEAVLP